MRTQADQWLPTHMNKETNPSSETQFRWDLTCKCLLRQSLGGSSAVIVNGPTRGASSGAPKRWSKAWLNAVACPITIRITATDHFIAPVSLDTRQRSLKCQAASLSRPFGRTDRLTISHEADHVQTQRSLCDHFVRFLKEAVEKAVRTGLIAFPSYSLPRVLFSLAFICQRRGRECKPIADPTLNLRGRHPKPAFGRVLR